MIELHASMYLNLDLDWPGFTLVNLDKHADGSLTLAQRPALIATVDVDAPQDAPVSSLLAVPAGIAVTPDCGCDLYISDPAQHRIWRIDSCVGTPAPFKCLHGPGALPGEVDTPRGLAIASAPSGPRLYVADSGNHRIQVIDLRTQQVLAVWGQPQPYLPPTPGDTPGRLDTPWDVAVDSAGHVYVVDYGNRRVQRFLKTGQVDETFWDSARAANLRAPIRVAAGDERILVLDQLDGAAQVVIYDFHGEIQRSWPAAGLSRATTLAVTSAAVYVGSFDGRIAKYSLEGQLLSIFESRIQPLAALARGCDASYLAGSGGLPVVRLGEDQGYVQTGSFQVGPFQTLAEALSWHRVQVRAEALSETCYLQLFTAVDTRNVPPPTTNGDNPFAGGWYALPRNQLDGLVLSQAVRAALLAGSDGTGESSPAPIFIWLGGLLHGDGSNSPIVRQIRLDFNPENLIRYMPAIYREGAQRRLFLDLLLATAGADLDTVEELLRALTTYFDPAAAPANWLPWIASWLDFTLIEAWSQADTRRNIGTAMQLYAQRGTVAGLKRYLELYAGIAARIEEPRAALFGLNDGLALGFNTVLAPAHEQGAVLASTATLGQSHLLSVEDVGAPVFEDVAHRFDVQVYAAQLTDPRARDAVIATLEREKPAHTTYCLSIIDARMRVGFQARIGVDSIVAGPTPDMRLGDPSPLGSESVLANQPYRANGRLGNGVRVSLPLS
jgi:phage tail-like protein